MKHYLLIYDLADDYLERRPAATVAGDLAANPVRP